MKRSHWYLSLAGVLALFIAAAIALALQLDGGGTARPRPPTSAAGSCRGNLPPQWQDALRAAVVALPQPVSPLAVDAHGVLYARTADAKIVAVDRQRNVRTVYDLPSGTAADQTIRVYPAAGTLIVVTLNATGERVSALTAVDPATGRAQRIATSGTVDGAAVVGAMLYWDQRPGAGNPGGVIRRYDATTGTSATVDFGDVTGPTATATGVAWGSGSAPAALPAKLKAALPADAPVTTDGASYAWTRGGALYWASSDGTVRGPLTQRTVVTPLVRAVSGPFVFFTADDASNDLHVMDARSGRVADTGLPFTGIAVDGGGVVALGGPLNGTTGTPPLLQFDTGGLPALGC